MSATTPATTTASAAGTANGPIDVQHGVTHFTYDFPPGTEIVDQSGKEEHIHYPMPSNDPADPLNWSRTWKFLTYGTFLFYLFWVNFALIGVTSIYAPLITELGFSVPAISEFTAWTLYMSGLGNLIWVPVGSMFGRRPVLIVSCLGAFATIIWFSRESNYRSMLASRILLGFFLAPVECFAPMICGDMFFTYQRARAHSWFFIILLVSTNVGGAVSGGFADSPAGWRSFFYFSGAMVIAALALVIVAMPETAFLRSAASSRGMHEVAPVKTEASSTNGVDSDEKVITPTTSAEAETATISLVGKGTPNHKQRWAFIASRDRTYDPVNALWRVVQTLTVMPVWLAIGWFGAAKGILVGQTYVAAQIWQAPPYNFSNADVGLTNIPGIVGTLAGCFFWGWLSDWDVARRTRNNGGIREPEMRLWLIIPGTIIGTIGGEIYGYGAEKHWAWEVILIVGVTLNFFGFLGPLICALSYAVDSYNRLGGEIGMLMCVIGNSWVFGIGYFVNDMLAEKGYGLGITLLQVPCWGMLVITIAYLFVGKQCRRWTANHPLVRK